MTRVRPSIHSEQDVTKPQRIEIIAVAGIPEVRSGDRLGDLIATACQAQETPIEHCDVVVVTQKVVSKAEGRVVKLSSVKPSALACQFADGSGRDPRLVELVLRESRAIVKMEPDRGILITETKHGLVCANAGIDASNVEGDDAVTLLPEDPDASARTIERDLRRAARVDELAVIVSDTFGRPWREGQVNFAIGVSGLAPFQDYRGSDDTFGNALRVTRIASVDELAAASELVMGKVAKVPAALIRGVSYTHSDDGSQTLIRARATDLFR